MKKTAVAYHSAHGYMKHIAAHVFDGTRSIPDVEMHVLKAEELAKAPEALLNFDGHVFGSPTYLGGVTSQIKALIDATDHMWRNQQLKARPAPGSQCRLCRLEIRSQCCYHCSCSA